MHSLGRFSAAVGGCILLWTATAAAQERIELLTIVDQQARMIEVDATVSGFGQVLSVTALTNVSTSIWRAPVALPGGRYLAWVASSPTQPWDVVLFDRRTKQRFYTGLPLPAPFAPTEIVTDPRRPRLFIVASAAPPISPSEVWVVDAAAPGIRRLAVLDSHVYGAIYAPHAELLFVRTAFTREFLAIDVTTGAVARRFPDPFAVGSMVVDAGATRLWHGANADGVRVADARSGIVLGASNGGGLDGMVLDEPRRRLLGIEPSDYRFGELVTALDGATLAPLWRTRVSLQLPGLLRSVALLPGRWMTGAYAVRTESRFDGPCNAIQIDVIDPDGDKRATADVLRTLGLAGGSRGCLVHAMLVRSPFAPATLTAAVAAGTVSLSWDDPGDATEFELEYGAAPSQRAGAFRTGAATRLTVPGVPAGVYYVRVRAFNEVGASPPSAEVRVVVP